MKKAIVKSLLLMTCFLYTHVAKAQKRICDQEVTCISPTGMVLNGDQLPLLFKLTNHGPDIIWNSDTTLYGLYVVQGQDTTTLYQGLIWGKSNDVIPIGESRMYDDGRKITFQNNKGSDTMVVDFCIRISSRGIFDNGDTLQFGYTDTVLDNNVSCQKVTIVRQKTNDITAIKNKEEALVLYPNPVKDMLYIRCQQGQGAMQIVIRDLSGRIMMEQMSADGGSDLTGVPVSLKTLPPGIYQVSMMRSDVVLTRKMVKI